MTPDLWCLRVLLEGFAPCPDPTRHPTEFRDDVAAIARCGEAPVEQIAKDFGISESCLRNWLRAADVEDGSRPGVTVSESAYNHLHRHTGIRMHNPRRWALQRRRRHRRSARPCPGLRTSHAPPGLQTTGPTRPKMLDRADAAWINRRDDDELQLAA